MGKGIIKASELRIGNWIMDRGGKQWQIDHWEAKNKVSAKEPEFNTCGMILKGHPLTEYTDYLKPIPLTEEWLVRFGFEGSEIFKNSYILNSVEIYIQDGLYWYDFGNDRVEIKYVHSLQNLVHALTNEELTIKENGK